MKFNVEGMTCGHCVNAITRAVERIGARADVDLAGRTVSVTGASDAAAVREAIEREGYTVTGVETEGSQELPVDAPHKSSCCGGCST
jgi:copper chaperone